LSKKTVKTIIDSKNDYIIGAKGNQKKLHNQIKLNISKNYPTDIDITTEKNRGRIEKRIVSIYNNLENINKDWIGLQTIIKVERFVTTKKKKSKEIAYFISSLSENTSAEKFNKIIRSHWSIENSLHYVKDTTFKEDSSKIKIKNAPQNISIIRNIIINIFRNNNFSNLAQAIRLVSNDISKIWNLILA